MDSFNHFRVKRQAHNISRQGTETWNPFRHVRWKPQRVDTWNGGRLEAQIEGNDEGEDLTHAVTSPYPNSGNVRDISTSATGQEVEEAPEKASQSNASRRLGDFTNQTKPTKEKPAKAGFYRHIEPLEPFTITNQLRRIFLTNMLSILLPLVPAGIALHITRGNSIETFIVNFLATFPLLNLANLGIDEIQLRLGKVYGNLLNITLYNLFQLISCILLLVNEEIILLQTTLIGGILANILLVLGLSFIAGGLRRPQQFYNITTTPVLSNLLSLSATSLLIPTASKLLGQTSDDGLAKQSRGASVILIIVYVLFLMFQLITHRDAFYEASKKVPVQPWSRESDEVPAKRWSRASSVNVKQGLAASARVGSIIVDMDNGREMANITEIRPNDKEVDLKEKSATQQVKSAPSLKLALAVCAQVGSIVIDAKTGEEIASLAEIWKKNENPQLYFPAAIFLFFTSSIILFFLVDYIVNSVNELATTVQLSKTFIGLILLPIPNCDPYTIYMAVRDEVDQVITNTIGKCIQTALCITPFIILLAWWLDIEGVTLVFDGFEIVSLFAAILLLNFVVSPGKDHWIQGVLLLADWGLIAIAAFFVDLGPYGSPKTN